MGGYTIHKNTYKSVIVNLITKYMRIYCKKLQTKIPGLVRGGGGEKKTNCDWIDLKSRGSFFFPSEDLLDEVDWSWIVDKNLLKR